ncbi:hypothetical protein [Paractinoplanes durhamensis]|uniref:hypothetical protein n=1 Tax=Paractinoplanes durhamensis TaxID=113563 RepID=UPI0036301D84
MALPLTLIPQPPLSLLPMQRRPLLMPLLQLPPLRRPPRPAWPFPGRDRRPCTTSWLTRLTRSVQAARLVEPLRRPARAAQPACPTGGRSSPRPPRSCT